MYDPNMVMAIQRVINGAGFEAGNITTAKKIIRAISQLHNRKPLTERQKQAHLFIEGFIMQYHMSPTTDEIANAMKTTRGNAYRFVDALVRKGWVKRVGKGARCLKIALI